MLIFIGPGACDSFFLSHNSKQSIATLHDESVEDNDIRVVGSNSGDVDL